MSKKTQKKIWIYIGVGSLVVIVGILLWGFITNWGKGQSSTDLANYYLENTLIKHIIRNFIISIYNKMPATENTTSNAGGGGGVTIVKKPIPRKYQTFSFRRLLQSRGGCP